MTFLFLLRWSALVSTRGSFLCSDREGGHQSSTKSSRCQYVIYDVDGKFIFQVLPVVTQTWVFYSWPFQGLNFVTSIWDISSGHLEEAGCFFLLVFFFPTSPRVVMNCVLCFETSNTHISPPRPPRFSRNPVDPFAGIRPFSRKEPPQNEIHSEMSIIGRNLFATSNLEVRGWSTWMSRWKLGSMARINGLLHLLINGVYWGYNPLANYLLTSWDIQVEVDFRSLKWDDQNNMEVFFESTSENQRSFGF